MPIRPENRARYPKDWPAIRAAIRERAGDRCEWCGIYHHAVGYRNQYGHFIPLAGNGPCDAAGCGRSWPDLGPLSYADAQEFVEAQNCCVGRNDRRCDDEGHHWFTVRLTIHHQDGVPENCDPDNLAALCERCHNRADAEMRRRNASVTLAAKRAEMLAVDRASLEAAGQLRLI